jgi:hypothetical protein
MPRRLAAPLALLPLLALFAGAAGAAPPDPAAALPAVPALPPLARRAVIERHTADTLWERIDGEAELYRAHGLAASAHALYEDPADPERRVDLSVFAFSDPLGAFGLFAAFRPPECAVRPLGNGGCLGDYQGFFWHGDLFVLADAAGSATSRPDDLRRALDAAAALLGPTPPRPEPLRALSRFADARTIRYQPRNLLGRAALPAGLEGSAGGTTVFLSVGDPAAAAAAATVYAAVLEGATHGERGGFAVLSGRDPALGPVTLLRGPYGICGARAAPDAPGLLELLEALGARGGDPAREEAW